MQIPESKQTAEALVVGVIGTLRATNDPSLFRFKRGTDPLDAMLEPAFHLALDQLHEQRFRVEDELLAIAVLLLARLKENDSEQPYFPVATALAHRGYSQLRFRNLIASSNASELFTQLQRAVTFCDGRVCPFDLTRVVLSWHESRWGKTRIHMARQYYNVDE